LEGEGHDLQDQLNKAKICFHPKILL
jgi:hypothetical protein